MGKTTDPLAKRYRNNARVDPSYLNHFLCYYCGKSSSDRVEYQLHMLKVHEVMSQSYQLWSDHTMDSLGLRWSQTRGHDDRETSCGSSMPASPREPKAKNSDDDDADYVYEEEKVAKKTKRTEKPRKIQENPKKNTEFLRKAEEKRQERAYREEEKRNQSRERRSTVEPSEIIEKPEQPPETKRKRRRTEGGSRWRDLKKEEQDDPDVAAMVTKILVESKKKEASSQDVEEEELTAQNKDRRPFDYSAHATKYCKVCKKGLHYTFASLFEHYQDHHHAVLKSFHYYGYMGKRLIGKKNVLERDYCQRCVIKFDRPRDYFTHMIHNHIYESVRCQLDFELADNADVEARMLFRDRIITLGYNFKFEETGNNTPYNDNQPGGPSTDTSFGEMDGPGTSSSTTTTTEEMTMKVEQGETVVELMVPMGPAEDQERGVVDVKMEPPMEFN